MSRKLPDICHDLIAAWLAWCSAENWDCPEYDPFAELLNELDMFMEAHDRTKEKKTS